MDCFTPEQRSKNMRAIKSKDTKEEIALAKALWHIGYRYRKNNKKVFGTPDLTFAALKIAIFVDGEFFHGKDWETRKKPQTNSEYWIKKIERNMQRDLEVNSYLESRNWKVLRFWSNDIKKNLGACILEIQNTIIFRSEMMAKIPSSLE
ncbi:very short patch repair endonuclease [Flavobacterium sp. LC2016-01]|uniref:very short patch repair endonuclease n=1 Tax=Flavobacterium sp. LC2016-01 TaxID=2675876 RepID=UPI0012BA8E7B|nr:very short patch repair endonuclease [Flavobacterium sp. LC2016-01]MTH15168.1 DNA mismatch endonuclease Vsr [Flavobacterium sp. LC2016-01]